MLLMLTSDFKHITKRALYLFLMIHTFCAKLFSS